MARDTILFDINETVLDLASLRPRLESVFGDAAVIASPFNEPSSDTMVAPLNGETILMTRVD